MQTHLDSLLGYFDHQILAPYHSESDKYEVRTDFFTGELSISDSYYGSLSEDEYEKEKIRLRFGYRKLKDGNLAVAAFVPDFHQYTSEKHKKRLSGFWLSNPIWTNEKDLRFQMWVDRHIMGSWEIECGPIISLGNTIKQINGLTSEIVGENLFLSEETDILKYPQAENSARYQDSHQILYGFLIDGISKNTIKLLAQELSLLVNIDSMKTIKALLTVFPELAQKKDFQDAHKLISEVRGKAAHGVRKEAITFNAFNKFHEDLSIAQSGFQEFLCILENKFDINSAMARERKESKEWLPTIVKDSEPHFAICKATNMIGKTVKDVKFGSRKSYDQTHESEALNIYFTDGSILGIQTGGNFQNIISRSDIIKPNDLHVDLDLRWVEPLKKKSDG